jgi:heat shock protein HslJ
MRKMMKKYVLFVAVLAALGILLAACTPAGGEPEIAADPTQPADTDAAGETNLERIEEESMEVTELEGARWTLVSYVNAAGETVEAMPDRLPTAEFSADGRVSGHAGCNSYFASYTAENGNLTIGQAGSTLMACEPPEAMQQEADFLAALQSAATYAIADGLLTIANADGATVLTLRPVAPTTLVGTNWAATMVNNGLEAVTGLTADTTITALFAEDGSLTGSAGCNNYMTSYTVDGQNITIQPPATTRKLCPEPAGIMEQEAAFTTMLPQAATYTISGDVLELRTADGALIVSFTAAE